jgi:glycosyltransferase involved in cell wall biosynthesis
MDSNNNQPTPTPRQRISIFSAFHPFRGGIAQFNERLVQSLEKEHNIQAFTFKQQYPNFLFPGTSQFVENESVNDAIKAKRIVSTFNPFSYLTAARQLKKAAPTLFITNYWMTFFAVFMGIFASKQAKSTPKIAIIHNLIPHEPRFFDKWLNRFFTKRYDGFIVMSDSVHQDVLAIKPNAAIMRINHPWYDHFGDKIDQTTARKELAIDPQLKTILFFGLIRDYKGLDLLIEAVSLLNNEYQLVIAGEVYSQLEKYTTLINQSPAKNRIHFFNRYIPTDEVNRYFSAADVCVLPYRTATQSGIIATAFHFEVPIISTNVGGLKKLIGHNEKGLVIENKTPKNLAESIEEYFNKNLKPSFQQTIRREKEQNSWDAFGKSLVSFGLSLKKIK